MEAVDLNDPTTIAAEISASKARTVELESRMKAVIAKMKADLEKFDDEKRDNDKRDDLEDVDYTDMPSLVD